MEKSIVPILRIRRKLHRYKDRYKEYYGRREHDTVTHLKNEQLYFRGNRKPCLKNVGR